MKKKWFFYVGLGLLISCQSLSEQHTTAFYQEISVQVLGKFAQEAKLPLAVFSEEEVSLGSDKKLAQDKPKYIIIEVVPDLMKFDTDTFTVTAGEKIILELDNLDGMQHNLLISEPGTLEKIGKAADAMLRDPKAAEMHYIPDVPEVLFATELVDPGEIYSLDFIAPKEPGEYPFVCTFPGHWRMMNGIMKVEKKLEKG